MINSIMDYQQLQLLGLNSYEAKILHTLLHKGAMKVSQLSRESGVPNGQIYNTLDSLEEKSLICIIPNKVKMYCSKSTMYINELLKEKTKELTALQTELNALKQIEEKRVAQGISIGRGKKGFHKMVLEKETYSNNTSPFAYDIKWNADVTDKNIQKFSNNSLKRGRKIKILYDHNAPKENIKQWEKYTPDYEFIEAQGIAMGINEDSTLISILDLDSTLLIKSKTFSTTMAQLFEGYFEYTRMKRKNESN